MKHTEENGSSVAAYEAPAIEVVNIQIENGFAGSPTSLEDLEDDDWWNGGFI
ncbi:MAG: hypothetical protein LBD45_06275 [Bacteroidales bacterium]|jgi:hypothetical protein|nr:hypothetical protein [Bacteroidales bacterium]